MARRLRQNAAGTINVITRDQDGIATAATGTPTVTIYKPDGTALVTAQNTTAGAVTGERIFVLTGAQTTLLGIYRAVWTATVGAYAQTFTTWFEVAGGFYYEIEEARSFDNAALANTTTYPNWKLIETREQVEDHLDRLTAVAFVPRARRLTLSGDGTGRLMLPYDRLRGLTSVSIDDSALDSTALAAITVHPYGVLERTLGAVWPVGVGNIDVDFPYGYDQVPDPIRYAALKLTAFRLLHSNVDDRATTLQDDLGTRTLAVAGRRFPTGIPEVDAIIDQWGRQVIA